MTALPLAAGLDGYVFKAKSPSCGVWGVPRYRPDGESSAGTGSGLYAGRVMAADPLLAVEDEGRMNDAGLREAFVERLFAAARLRDLLSGGAEPGDLVAFHARHKLQLLAHDPARYRAAGQVVARAGAPAGGEAAGGDTAGGDTAGGDTGAAAYRELFLAAMASPATPGRNANALQHAYSRIGPRLPHGRREDLLARIEAYRRGEVPLSVPVALLDHYASTEELPWLAGQTYLAPFPAALRLRNAIPARP
jgi:uncharacterized protein YbgA (DUF1722 family)